MVNSASTIDSGSRVPDRPRIAHVGIAVPDLARRFPSIVTSSGSNRALPSRPTAPRSWRCPFGESEVELLAPLAPDTPIGKFLAKRGPGIHHICYRVPDLDAALDACRAAGYRLIDEVPRSGAAGRRIAFVHPKATAGILLELTD